MATHKTNSNHWHLSFLKLDCAVPDCDKKADDFAKISINNAPKKRLAVCRRHADAAADDTPVGDLGFNKQEAIDDLKRLNGLPPYDGFNPCCGDGYFAASLIKKYRMSIAQLEKAVGFAKIVAQWKAVRTAFISQS